MKKSRQTAQLNSKIIPLKMNREAISPDCLLVHNVQGTHYLPYNDIIRLEASGNYTYIITLDQKILASKTMKFFEVDLPAKQFIRIHASHIINLDYLRFNARTFVRLSNGDEVRVSRGRRSSLDV